MTFLLGVAVGILATVGFSFLSMSSLQDDIDNNTDFR